MATNSPEKKANEQIKVLVPNSLQSQRLYLLDGRVFDIVTVGKIFKKRKLKEDEKLWAGIDKDVVEHIVNAESINAETNASLVDHFANLGNSAFEPLLKTALQELRRKLITSSAGQLELLFKEFLCRHQKQIVKAFAAEKSKGVIKFSGFIPKLTRFRWSMISGDTEFSVYCFELPPHKRHIRMGTETSSATRTYNWVIPWLCILAMFTGDDFVALTAFYRNKPLDNAENTLLMCGLPGKSNRCPWEYCGSAPEIKLSDPEWVDKLLTWFFDSKFLYHNETSKFDGEFYKVKKSVPECRLFSEWEKFSDSKDSLERVCKINFPLAPNNLQQYVLEIMEYLSAEKAEHLPDIFKEKEFINLAKTFEQTAREKFVFLVGKTAVESGIKDKINLRFAEVVNSLKAKLSGDLSLKINGLGEKIRQNLTNRIQQAAEERTE